MTTDHSAAYPTAAAFRRALTDRLRAIATPNGPWPLADLQRQFAYDRLLARLYLLHDDWVLKGATALLARDIAVRHTVDLDIYRATSRADAERDLRTAATLDAGDWFGFETGRGTPVADGVHGIRIPVVAHLGATVWMRFHVDVVADEVRMTGQPDVVPPLTAVQIPGLTRLGYRAYPVVDHIADKTCAMLERHGAARRPSTRFKDLVDLVRLTAYANVAADAQRRALVSEANRRELTLPSRLDVPDRALWKTGYAAEARRAITSIAANVDDALAEVRQYLDPVLADTASGVWHPDSRTWES